MASGRSGAVKSSGSRRCVVGLWECLNREVREYDGKDSSRMRRNDLHILEWLFVCHTFYKKYSQKKYLLN